MAKIINGEKRGRPGRWIVDFYDQGGKRRWETFPTKEQALSRQGDLEGQVDRKTYLPPKQRPTVEKIAEAWLANKQQRRPATIAGWENHVYGHIVPRIGTLRVDLVNPVDVERFRDSLIEGEDALAPKTANKILTTLTSIFDLAMRDYPELAKRNPAALAERLRPRVTEELKATEEATDEDPLAVDPSDIPTPEQAGLLIENAGSGLFRAYFATAVLMGGRSEELLALSWRHVDLDGSIKGKVDGPKILIRRVASWARTRKDSERPNGARFFPPKTKALRREIPIPAELVEVLKVWRRDCPTPFGLVFPKPDGSPMHRKVLYDQGLLPALAAAKLEHFTVHSLRHCFASSLAAAGRPPMEIAGYLGHSSADVTLRVYAHWFPKDRTGAMESHAGRVLGSSATKTGSSNR